ncbi:hypothetical protein QKT49_gp022 [Acanthamoeba castellanii medusavirus]|uniref:Uncharacterized protein n=1 Tax=Acanthamoeba castellanii medusavirus J1 TaxID=3114988 RepID=A0A3T1CWF9_9VIRU|nr:hypothetical protein QKT49_gp022 [Acanthamoeba castellanii medusavirus]BBI30162.1 hypothetical protein [Acanthamoeba castellanii medusavirus J1]
MQELLTREEKHNKRLLKPFLDALWSDGAPSYHLMFVGKLRAYAYDARWYRNYDPSKTTVTRELMENDLLRSLRRAERINAAGERSRMCVEEEKSYISVAIEALCTGIAYDAELVTTGRSFLDWDDEIALWRRMLDERMAAKPISSALERASDRLRCAECWLRRIYACEAMRTHVLFPAQLALAENVCPLSE